MPEIGVRMDIPDQEELETILWFNIAEWCDAKPGEYAWLDLAVKNYAFKIHCRIVAMVQDLKVILSMKWKLEP